MTEEKQKFTLGFIFDSKLEKILLIKKNCPDFQRNKLNGLGGKLEENECPYSGITRETQEESELFIDEFKWNKFCELDTKFGYVYCFYTVTDDIYNYKQIEDEPLSLYLVEEDESIIGVPYFYFDRMANLDYLIPMSLNHAQKLDECELFKIKETYNK